MSIQSEKIVIVARDLGDTLEVILRTDDFGRACVIFLDEWQKDRRVCMLGFTPAVIIAAAAKREYDDQIALMRGWEGLFTR